MCAKSLQDEKIRKVNVRCPSGRSANYNFRWLGFPVFYNGDDQTQIHVSSLIIASMAPANPPTMAPFNRIY